VESRDDKRPQLSDLRESGSIEQDADMVWFLYREDYYEMSKEPNIEQEPAAYAEWAERMDRIKGHSELIVAKQRHGATGKVRLFFDAKITRFSDLADDGRYDSGGDD
jgi:replicative DNA helicase